jgi:hypothetical protein
MIRGSTAPRRGAAGGVQRRALWGRLGRGGVSGTPDAAVKEKLGQNWGSRVNRFVPRVGRAAPDIHAGIRWPYGSWCNSITQQWKGRVGYARA